MSDTGALDARQILGLLPHRYPFLLIDRVIRSEPGKSATAIKCVSASDPVFQGHFPGYPVMPGVLIAEAFAQTAAIVALTANPELAGQGVFLMGLDKVRFRKPVVPGDTLTIHVETTYARRRMWTFACRGEVDGARVAEGEVMATIAATDAES